MTIYERSPCVFEASSCIDETRHEKMLAFYSIPPPKSERWTSHSPWNYVNLAEIHHDYMCLNGGLRARHCVTRSLLSNPLREKPTPECREPDLQHERDQLPMGLDPASNGQTSPDLFCLYSACPRPMPRWTVDCRRSNSIPVLLGSLGTPNAMKHHLHLEGIYRVLRSRL